MDAVELSKIIQKGESSTAQFKERVNDAYSIATEMVALSNSKGGLIIVGINDKTGAINGLSFQELQATNQLLVNAASEIVKSPITIFTETVKIREQNLIVVKISEGSDKPYKDNKGIIWLKNGSDKRKVISNEALVRLLQSSGHIYADEQVVNNTATNDIDVEYFKKFIKKKTKKTLSRLKLTLPQVLQNMSFAKGEKLTLSGLLLFGNNPQRYRPVFSVQCIAYVGNEISGTEFRDNEPLFEGNLEELYKKTMSFITRNLRKIQVEKSFNSIGQLEIPIEAFEELVVNALIHRDYYINSSVKVFIFDDRIEIVSPGKLPNMLTVEKIKSGTSIAKNPILFSNARYLLPFTGVGSGVPRACAVYPQIDFINDPDKEVFTVIIRRNL